MPVTINITADGTTGELELPLGVQYKLSLRGTLYATFELLLEYTDIGSSTWYESYQGPDEADARERLNNKQRDVVAFGTYKRRGIVSNFAGSSGVTLVATEVPERTDVEILTLIEQVVDQRKLVKEDVEYQWTNSVSGSDLVTIART